MADYSSSTPAAGDSEMQEMLRAEMQKAQINSTVMINSFDSVWGHRIDWVLFISDPWIQRYLLG